MAIGIPRKARQKAIQHAGGLIRANLKSKKSFALETVLSHSGLSLIQRAKRGGYITRLYFFGTESPAINITRVAARKRAGGHDIPETTIIRRYHEAMETLPAAIAAADFAFVYDNSRENAPLTRLFHTEHGQITQRFVQLWPPVGRTCHQRSWAVGMKRKQHKPTPPGEILTEESLAPLSINQSQLARDIHMPAIRIANIRAVRMTSTEH